MDFLKTLKNLPTALAVKHLENRFLSNNQHLSLANGELITLGFDNGKGKATDSKLLSEGYEKNAQAYSIIRKISETGSDIPWIAEEVKRDGTTEPVIEGKFADFVAQPNERETQKEFKNDSFGYYLTTGDLFWLRKDMSIGFPTDNLKTLPSQLTDIVAAKDHPLHVVKYELEIANLKRQYLPEEVIHQKYFNPSTSGIISLRGLSPLAAAFLVLSGDNQRAEAQESMMRNRGAAGILTNETDTNLTPDERDIQQALLDKKLGGSKKFNQLIVGRNKSKFLQLGMSATDLKILETTISNLRQLCNVYSAPSELFNDPANKTFANQKTAMKAFYENAVLPIDRQLLNKYNAEIVSEWSKKDGKKYRVVQDLSHVGALQEDEKAKADKDRSVLQGVNIVLNMAITSEAKTILLMDQYGMSADNAAKIVAPTGKANATLELLRSMSPLLANKFIEKMTEEQILDMLK